MKSQEILQKYIEFYKQRGHALVPNVSLVPENDPTLLFVNSGMFPLVPYLSGEPHPLGKRLVNVQRSLRFDDLENVGKTNRHTVAFHMIGNWSLGDYFKKEQLPWVYEFFVEVVGLDINRIYATVFAGDPDAPKDEESISIIKSIFKKYGIDAQEGERIFAQGKEDNWWKRGDAIGELGGPDSEVFYYIGKDGTGIGKNPAEHQNEFLEIGNSVFMQYKKAASGWEELSQKNVDFGGGLERIALVAQGKSDIFQTDNFWPMIEKVQELTGLNYVSDEKIRRNMRVIADHMRASTFLAMDGVVPSNKDQGYVLRRLLRRMMRVNRSLNLNEKISGPLLDVTIQNFAWLYPKLVEDSAHIKSVFEAEEEKFSKTLDKGSKETQKILAKLGESSPTALAKISFDLYQSLGYPKEIFVEDVIETHGGVDEVAFEKAYNDLVEAHQAGSRSGAEQKFKGGLADHSEQTVQYHTATHLLHMALRKFLGNSVSQKGSNITGERLRFDFAFSRKLTDTELLNVESEINKFIDLKLPVNFVLMSKEEAEKTGALHFFGEKYGDSVKVYFIGNSLEDCISKEFCGGPHVKNLSELSHLHIYKQEMIGQGLMRVYARF